MHFNAWRSEIIEIGQVFSHFNRIWITNVTMDMIKRICILNVYMSRCKEEQFLDLQEKLIDIIQCIGFVIDFRQHFVWFPEIL